MGAGGAECVGCRCEARRETYVLWQEMTVPGIAACVAGGDILAYSSLPVWVARA